MLEKSLSQAELARLAGVSRATVTQWLHKGQKAGWVNVETDTLRRLAEALNLTPDYFLQPCQDLSRYGTEFLWDRCYPDMASFLKALREKREPALARLVQVVGFQQAKNIVGSMVYKKFHQYKRFIKPIRRKELELLWPLYASNP